MSYKFKINPITGDLDTVTTPTGLTGSLQYNNAGAFGGFGIWDPVTKELFMPHAEVGDSNEAGSTIYLDAYNRIQGNGTAGLGITSNYGSGDLSMQGFSNVNYGNANGEFGDGGIRANGSFNLGYSLFIGVPVLNSQSGTVGGNGYLGIFNQTPSYPVDIYGNTHISGDLIVHDGSAIFGSNINTFNVDGSVSLSSGTIVIDSNGVLLNSSVYINSYTNFDSFGNIILNGNEIVTSNGLVSFGGTTGISAHITSNGDAMFQSINIPVITTPSSPADGDIWREDNTDTGFKIQINGVTKTITLT